MAQALDSAYEWGINKQNQGNLSASELVGLGSLAPQSGIGLLGNQAPRTALNPYSQLPTPNFQDPSAFNFEDPAITDIAVQSAQGGVNPLSFERAISNVGNTNSASPTNAPYFDPNYPYESMLALKNWLQPQVAAGVAPAENSRGVGYSGVGQYATADANNYLSQLAPVGETGQQALGNDLNFLYGPNIANSLIEGTPHTNGAGFISSLPSSVAPGATPFGGGSTNSEAAFITNPNYVALPSGPPDMTPPDVGDLPGPPGVIRPAAAGTASSTPVPPEQQPYAPQFGLYDLKTMSGYETPGYWYNPNQAPDTSRMPWLKDATPYSTPTSGA